MKKFPIIFASTALLLIGAGCGEPPPEPVRRIDTSPSPFEAPPEHGPNE